MLTKIIKYYSNKLSKDTRNFYIELMKSKLKSQNTEKFQLLSQLHRAGNISLYFQNKNVYEFSLEDIYFYSIEKENYSSPLSSLTKAIITNSQFKTCEKFQVSIVLNLMSIQRAQILLAQDFNKNCRNLTNKEIAFCLKFMKDFSCIKKQLYFQQLNDYFEHINNDEYAIEAIFQVLNFHDFIKDLEKIPIEKYLYAPHNLKNINLKKIYQAKFIEDFFQKTPPAEVENERKNVYKKEVSKKTVEQSQQRVKLLSYFPQFTYMVKVQYLSSTAYILFLEHFEKSRQKGDQLIVLPHKIPPLIFQSDSQKQVMEILILRLKLKIDTINSIIKHIRKHFTKKLAYIQVVIQILKDSEADIEIWNKLELALIQKFRLKAKDKNLPDLLKQYQIGKVMKILSKVRLYASISFKKYAYSFFVQTLASPSLIQDLNETDQNFFIITCFDVKMFAKNSSEVDQKLKNLLKFALIKNFWSLKSISYLLMTLVRSKITDNEIWYALQKKVLSSNIYKVVTPSKQKQIYRIVFAFDVAKKGSFLFWKMANEIDFISWEVDPFGRKRVAPLPIQPKEKLVF